MSCYMVKIVETHLEIIEEKGCCFRSIFKVICHFHLAAILDFAGRKKKKPIFSESSCIKNIRPEVKLLLTDISHGKYTVSLH